MEFLCVPFNDLVMIYSECVSLGGLQLGESFKRVVVDCSNVMKYHRVLSKKQQQIIRILTVWLCDRTR